MLKERLPYQPPTGVFDNALFAGVQMLQEQPTNVPPCIKLSSRAEREEQPGPVGYTEALQRQALQRRQWVRPKDKVSGDPGEAPDVLEAVLQEAGLATARHGRALAEAGLEKVADLRDGELSTAGCHPDLAAAHAGLHHSHVRPAVP